MGGLECVITGLLDEFEPFFKKYKITREIFTGIVVFTSFLVALSCVTPVGACKKTHWWPRIHHLSRLSLQGGLYVFTMFERYAAGLSLLCTVFFEAVAVSWFYGKILSFLINSLNSLSLKSLI